jgi:hypothetical protein
MHEVGDRSLSGGAVTQGFQQSIDAEKEGGDRIAYVPSPEFPFTENHELRRF